MILMVSKVLSKVLPSRGARHVPRLDILRISELLLSCLGIVRHKLFRIDCRLFSSRPQTVGIYLRGDAPMSAIFLTVGLGNMSHSTKGRVLFRNRVELSSSEIPES